MIPRGVGAGTDDIVTLETGNRDRGDLVNPDRGGKAQIFSHNLVKPGLAVVNQIQLVHRQHDVANADEMG